MTEGFVAVQVAQFGDIEVVGATVSRIIVSVPLAVVFNHPSRNLTYPVWVPLVESRV